MEELAKEEEQRRKEEEKVEKARKAKSSLFDDMDRNPHALPASQTPASALSSSAPATAARAGASASSSASPPAAQAATSPSSNGGGYVPPGWSAALPDTRRTDLADPSIESTGIALSLCGCGMPDGNAFGAQVLGAVGMHAPSVESFDDFYQTWFEEEFFPVMSQNLKRELVNRAKSKGFLSGLSSQVKKWAMANTDERLQADAWLAYFKLHSPAQFQSFGVFLQASVNLGSAASPCWVSFWGYPDASRAQWLLPPWASYDTDVSSIVDELDERGGMAALVEAAAQ